MDRLICGDVGYGKTEVALRAAFKAAADGKQVLMLVPTTILAQQHYGTFAERLADYPFTLEHVSRFRTAGRAERGDQGLRRGARRHPDRHAPRALARRAREGPRPADRRRGAALRRQAEGAAAPAEAAGRRDRDVGHADPAHAADVARRAARHLRDRDAAGGPAAGARPTSASTRRSSSSSAIEREHERGGQAFFLHNRVETIEETAERLRALCPGVRFAVAHGQMGEGELEDGDDGLPARRRRRARVHVDHRVGHRHPAGEHADRRARRRVRPGPALPDPRTRRAQPRARVRLPALRLGARR